MALIHFVPSYDIKCLIDELLNGIENTVDGVLNGQCNELQRLVRISSLHMSAD